MFGGAAVHYVIDLEEYAASASVTIHLYLDPI